MLNFPPKKLIFDSGTKESLDLSFGGIGTGCVRMNTNGEIYDFDITDIPELSHKPISFYIIKAQSANETKIFILQSKQTDVAKSKYNELFNVFSPFENSPDYVSFPFFEKFFCNQFFPGKIKLNAWNPFIPNNETDSGIPALLSEYEIENTSSEEITYTIYGILENPNASANNKFVESRKDEIKYLKLSGLSEDVYARTDMCIGICGKNIDCAESVTAESFSDIVNKLNNYILTGDISYESYSNDNLINFGIISSSLTLKPGEQDKIRFATSWYSPYFLKERDLFEKKYYTRYFTGADECAFYCLSQWERLYEETDNFRKLLYSSTLPEDILYKFTCELFAFNKDLFSRAFDGTFYNFKYDSICNNDIFQTFFSGSVRALLEQIYSNDKDEKNIIIFFPLLCNYLKTSGNIDFIKRIWKSISGLIANYCDKHHDAYINEAAMNMATAINDRKKIELFSRLNIGADIATEQNNCQTALYSIKKICGQCIDASANSFTFSPDMSYSVKGVFQCILCFDSFLGYIERGIDYIQIKCLKGKTSIRNINVPDIPLKIKCAGFEIGFITDGNTAILDNDCEINPSRDLLVIFRS